MRGMKYLNTVDLFCGAGGASTGCDEAFHRLGFKRMGIAINHWNIAVDTMRANHPNLTTLDCKIEEAIPAELVHDKVHLLWASPSCVHHSRARGGKPRSDQQRSQPEFVITWLTQCDVDNLIVENVPEFMDWGPLIQDGPNAGQPDKLNKGKYFRAWIAHIQALGYNLKYDVLCCADYGDATTRKRFFLVASKVGLPEPSFPKPQYGNHVKGLKQWRAIRECLDLSDTGKSIFGRKKPLARNTMRRIMVGMKKFNGMNFLVDMLGAGENDNCRLRQLELPLPTQHAGGNRFGIVQPFIVKLRNCETVGSVEDPLNTITTTGAHHMLCQPIVVDHLGKGKAHSLDEAMGTQCTHDRYSLVTPFIMNNNNNNAPRGVDEPVHALTTGNHAYLCTPLVIGQNGGSSARPIDDPCPTIATKGAIRVATPIIIDGSRPGASKNDSSCVRSADDPICTITTCDAMQLGMPVLEDGRIVDIRIRMLKPSELAAAHSFPKGYVLTGNRGEQVKQIGNSVPVMTAAALCEQMLKKYVD